jgi:uncharacterized integral membrane protein (TIGR00698 family)
MNTHGFFQSVKTCLPGIVLCALIALLAECVHLLPFKPFTVGGHHPIEGLTIALVLGMVFHPLIKRIPQVHSGIAFCSKTVLYLAIVLLGVKLNVALIEHLNLLVLTLVVVSVFLCFFLTYWFGRLLNVPVVDTLLIAFGTAICGSSAIAAMAPAVHANKKQTAMAIAVINLFGTLAIFIFPLLGHVLHLSPTHFYIWAGASIQAVPQVIAACVTFNSHGAVLGTTVKLVRVLLLAPLLLIALRIHRASSPAVVRLRWYRTIPPFIIGFFVVIFFSNVLARWGLTRSWIGSVQVFFIHGSHALMIAAMAAIGLQVSFVELKHTGSKSLILSGFGAFLLAGFVLLCLLLPYF